ncbi:MAG: GNAT family N-acetyltransferase [bacterium]|nr:GNAT family N-acetyltransferase [bacterium]
MRLDVVHAWVPCPTFFWQQAGVLQGVIHIRHSLVPSLEITGGHIGFPLAPAHSGQGVASRMLASALTECRRLGIKKALLTCDSNNEGSSRTIENQGGRLERDEWLESTQKNQRWYWIDVGWHGALAANPLLDHSTDCNLDGVEAHALLDALLHPGRAPSRGCCGPWPERVGQRNQIPYCRPGFFHLTSPGDEGSTTMGFPRMTMKFYLSAPKALMGFVLISLAGCDASLSATSVPFVSNGIVVNYIPVGQIESEARWVSLDGSGSRLLTGPRNSMACDTKD